MPVCGFISRDGDAYSTYFALLHTGHDEIVVLLTISIGKWYDDDALDERPLDLPKRISICELRSRSDRATSILSRLEYP